MKLGKKLFFSPSCFMKMSLRWKNVPEQDFSFHRVFGKPSSNGRKWLNQLLMNHRIRQKPKVDGNQLLAGNNQLLAGYNQALPSIIGACLAIIQRLPGSAQLLPGIDGCCLAPTSPCQGSYWLHSSTILILQDCSVSIDIEATLAAMDSIQELFAVLYIVN